MVQTFDELVQDQIPVDFYHRLGRYLERVTYAAGETLWREGDRSDCLMILEQGSLRSMMYINKNEQVVVESILPGTVVGELGLFTASQHRTRSVNADQDSILWKLSDVAFARMMSDDPQLALQFILLSLHFSSERLDTMTRYAFQLH